MIQSVYRSELPIPEAEFRIEFANYLRILNETPPGYPVNYVMFPLFTELAPNFTVMEDPLPQQILTLSKHFEDAVNGKIQEECTAAGFDNINTARAYASTDNPLQAQSISFVNWTAAVWLYCKQYLEDVQNGVRPIPELEEYLATLPTRVVPP